MLRLAAELDEPTMVCDKVRCLPNAEPIGRYVMQLVEPAIANLNPVRGEKEPFLWGIRQIQGQPVVSLHGFAKAIMRQAVELQLLQRLEEFLQLPAVNEREPQGLINAFEYT